MINLEVFQKVYIFIYNIVKESSMLKLFALKSCFVGSSDVFLEAVLWNRIGFLSDPDPEF